MRVSNTYATDTILFKDVIPDYQTFISSEQAVETIPNINIFDNGTVVETAPALQTIYRLIKRRYMNCQIAFSTEDDFLNAFWEKLEINVPNYYDRYFRYQTFLKMTDKELLNVGEVIENYVEHTDEAVEAPLDEPLENITNQTASRQYADKAARLRQRIQSAQYALINDFLSYFKPLFMKIFPQTVYVDCSSEDDEEQ